MQEEALQASAGNTLGNITLTKPCHVAEPDRVKDGAECVSVGEHCKVTLKRDVELGCEKLSLAPILSHTGSP